ncbi:hypothetical protein [Rhizobium sp.]|uniref:tetratricopeptide repeat protein n=1 Tax=Rhizobium sp. TaxID=391 RepID=UPI0028A9B656
MEEKPPKGSPKRTRGKKARSVVEEQPKPKSDRAAEPHETKHRPEPVKTATANRIPTPVPPTSLGSEAPPRSKFKAAKTAPSWFSRSLVGGLFTIALFTWLTWLVLEDLAVDIAFDPPILPASLIDAGVGADDLLASSIADFPADLERYSDELADAGRSLISGSEPVTVGDETYCVETSYRKMVALSKAYFSPNRIRIEQTTQLNASSLGIAQGQKLLDRIRSLLKFKFQRVSTRIIQDDGKFTLSVTIAAKAGVSTSISRATFNRTIATPDARSAERLLREVILRVAYPELSSLVRNVNRRSDLDIEAFEANNYPSPDRTAMLDFGLFAGLVTHPDGTNQPRSYKRAAFVANRALETAGMQFVSFDKELFDFMILNATRGYASSESGLEIFPPEDFADAMDVAIKKYAERLGVDVAAIGKQSAENEFRPENRAVAVLTKYADLVRPANKDRVEANRQSVIDRIMLARAGKMLSDPNASAYLREITLTYGLSVFQLLTVESSDETEQEKALAFDRYIAFHDFELDALLSDAPLMSSSDRATMELVVAAIQTRREQYSDALFRAKHLLGAAPPCQLAQAANVVVRAIRDKPKSLFPDEVSALNDTAYQMLEKAEKLGLRNFGLFNDMGLAVQRVGNTDGAIRSFDRAQSYNGEQPWAELNAGYALMDGGEVQDAQARFENSIVISTTRCIDDAHDWADIDDDYNALTRKSLKEIEPSLTDDQNPLIISHSSTERDCAIPSASLGLLGTLAAQDKASEFARVYRRHFPPPSYKLFPEEVRKMVGQLQRFQCDGKLPVTPDVPDELKAEFLTPEGKFVCGEASQAIPDSTHVTNPPH